MSSCELQLEIYTGDGAERNIYSRRNLHPKLKKKKKTGIATKEKQCECFQEVPVRFFLHTANMPIVTCLLPAQIMICTPSAVRPLLENCYIISSTNINEL